MGEYKVTDRTEAAQLLPPEERLAYVKAAAINDGMDLLEHYRLRSRYDYTAYPPVTPEILVPAARGRADQIWEGSMNWTNPGVQEGTLVTGLDTNAAFLSATNTHLPIGQLVHAQGHEAVFHRQRSGLYLVTPPEWDFPHLPNPLGNRKEAGQLWVGRPTLQLLMDCATERYGSLCDQPQIHETWTSGSTDAIFRKWREQLRDARAQAILTGDELTVEYVKAVYSQTISTLDGAKNRHIRRREWRHLIRAQAFANLWRKAWRARANGLTVYRVFGTDELHVVGDWRPVFPEGRSLTEMKLKRTLDPQTGTESDGTYAAPARRRGRN